jgi:hypothetical protein
MGIVISRRDECEEKIYYFSRTGDSKHKKNANLSIAIC